MPYKTPAHLRKSAFVAQHGLCCYCGKPMWLSGLAEFATQNGYSLAQARLLQCTAEHLQARRDGGHDSPSNIAAACRYCNNKRHMRKRDLSPEQYREFVLGRLRKGGWHGLH